MAVSPLSLDQQGAKDAKKKRKGTNKNLTN